MIDVMPGQLSGVCGPEEGGGGAVGPGSDPPR